uniref:non-ribosomal peptide synthetase n=1 Tax=Salegentibacter sp. UBA1130 TaxID=1947451 RepID=UPI0025809F65
SRPDTDLGLHPVSLEGEYEVSKFDLSFFLFDNKEELEGKINYATSLFRRDTIERMLNHYTYLLEDLVEAPEKLYGNTSLLSEEDYQRVIYNWNDTNAPYPSDKTIHELFETQVAKTPNAVALVFEGEELTYSELNKRSNQLARHIRNSYKEKHDESMPVDTCIGLYLERSMDMIVSILGVLKAGGAYVPMDPAYPENRITYILEDTKAEFLLTQTMLIFENLSSFELESEIIAVDAIEELDGSNLNLDIDSNALAYVIYTSGTTGHPKGVMVEHKNVVNFLTYYQLNSGTTSLTCKIIFDVSVLEIFSSLESGSTLYIPSEETVSDPMQYADYLYNNEISHCYIHPMHLLDVSNKLSTYSKVHLKRILIGVERIAPKTIAWYNSQKIQIINGYGPTENTICSTTYEIKNLNEIVTQNIPIGKPISNYQVFILAPNNIPQPKGIIGEICVSGDGISRGYLNKPILNDEKFVPNPFKSGTKMFKTGDLGRYLEDGNIEFVGRKDGQIKINGYRIEPGEIESILTDIKGVSQAYVKTQERLIGQSVVKNLVGYYVLEESQEAIQEIILLEKLSSLLPAYMVPKRLMKLDRFPLTMSGKLDKRSLPEVNLARSEEEYVSPQTETERALCRIWEEVLGLDRVGVTDDFFRIGGDSILGISLSIKMKSYLKQDIKVSDIFRFKTINQLIKKTGNPTEIIKPYSTEYKSQFKNLIFVHPGGGGSEMYQSLAQRLIPYFNCIGIDSFNLYNTSKIDSLSSLANYYLKQYRKHNDFGKQINLISWSFGGLIAMKMASILEKEGYGDINIFLLDTYIKDAKMRDLGEKLFLEGNQQQEEQNLIKQARKDGISEELIKNWLENNRIQNDLSNTTNDFYLEESKIYLFKSINSNYNKNSQFSFENHKHMMSMRLNNVDTLAKRVSVINYNCSHKEILTKKELDISNFIMDKLGVSILNNTQ